MSGVKHRALGTRAAWIGCSLILATACFAPELTNFYEEPSAIVAVSGAAGSSSEGGESNEGGTQGSAAGAGALAGSGGTGTAGAAAAAGSGAGTGTGGGAAGSDTAGGASSSDGGMGGDEGSVGGGAGDLGSGGSAGTVSCEAFGTTAAAFDGHCYLFVDAELPFRAAADDCKERGGHLVTLSSENRTRTEFLAENSFVWGLGAMTAVWIAASDDKGPHQPGDGTYYEWTNGEPMTFDNWSEAQPNNSPAACQDDRPCSCDQSTCYEHCGFQWLNAGKDGSVPGWNDRLCEHEIAYVCEWDNP